MSKMSLSEFRKSIIGRKIKSIRLSTKEEQEREGWHEDFEIITLDNGTELWPMCDGEGNGPGVMVGSIPKGNEPFGFYLRDAILKKGEQP
jgi:hypothetical protein